MTLARQSRVRLDVIEKQRLLHKEAMARDEADRVALEDRVTEIAALDAGRGDLVKVERDGVGRLRHVRRIHILARMHDDGHLTEDQFTAAWGLHLDRAVLDAGMLRSILNRVPPGGEPPLERRDRAMKRLAAYRAICDRIGARAWWISERVIMEGRSLRSLSGGREWAMNLGTLTAALDQWVETQKQARQRRAVDRPEQIT